MIPDEQSTSDYSYHSSTAETIDFSKLPHGFCFLYNPPFRKDQLRDDVLKVLQKRAASVHRFLTPDETTALAYHSAKRMAVSCWAMPTGFGIASAIYEVTREDYGAIKSEGGWFDGERIRIMGRELLRGISARATVNALRYCSYALPPAACIYTYGWFVSTSGITNDPRLNEFNAELRARQGIPIEQGGKSVSGLWKEHKDNQEGEKARRDQDSFLAGRDGMEYSNNEEIVGGDDVEGTKRGALIKLQEMRQQPVPSSPRSIRTVAERQPVGFTDHNQDSSSSTERDRSQEPSDGGSAWERIRRGAGSPASSKNQRRGGWQQQREGSGRMGGDDFTFSSSEQERSYAQEEAQRVLTRGWKKNDVEEILARAVLGEDDDGGEI